MAPQNKRIKKDGDKKKMMITVTVKKEIIEKHKRGMRIVDIARFYNRSTSTICTILKRKEEITGLDVATGVTRISKQRPHGLDVATGVTRISKQRPHVLEDVENVEN
ncbi:hypothetical protein QE152_g32641 [Popillia japonica]|uniref:HTH psq-type domain-containing protein n=1 Tax=Popillia japonica TaxID=7064 RepID=A0AAW1IY31_POPJA